MASILKRFTQSYSHADTPSLVGRTFALTGASNGIGLSLSRTLYSHGAKLFLLSSNDDNAERAIDYIRSGDLSKAPQDYQEGFGGQKDDSGAEGVSDGSVEWEKCDLSDLNQVAEVGHKLATSLDKLDGVYFIAGIGVNEFKLTKDGYE